MKVEASRVARKPAALRDDLDVVADSEFKQLPTPEDLCGEEPDDRSGDESKKRERDATLPVASPRQQ